MKFKSLHSNAWDFHHTGFAPEWFDGLPLGNGDLGALMMADQRQIRFPLAKSDLWDERCDDGSGQRRSCFPFKNFAELRALIKKEQWDEIDEGFERKRRKWKGSFCLLPAGTLILDTSRFEKEIESLEARRHLDMHAGVADNWFRSRIRRQHVEALVSVEHQVLAIHVKHDMDWRKGAPPRRMTFGMDISLDIRPSDPMAKVETGLAGGVLWRRVRGYHEVDYTIAVTAKGRGVCVGMDKRNRRLTITAPSRAEFTLYLSMVSRKDTKRTKREAQQRVRRAAVAGYARIRKTHRDWWRKFWGASCVRIPDQNLLRQYHFGLYLLGSSSRKGFQMPGLQGVWYTRHPGTKWNEYTNDLNIQMCYWPIYTSNHLEVGWPYYDTVRRWLPEARKYTREYWGCRGVQFSCCASSTGLVPLGYLTTMHWAGHAAFVAQNFWTHYLYSRDERFLCEVAYPFLKECTEFYLDFLKKDRRGFYEIWPSNTPEAGEGSYEAWGKNPTMDLALLRMLFGAVIESTKILDCDFECRQACQERLDHLPPYPMRDGALIDMEGKEFHYSHRHNGMITPIYPCADTDISRKAAEKTLDRFEARGRWLWGCHTHPWEAAAAARLGRGEAARDLLAELFESYFPPQGGFNLNYNYHRKVAGIIGPPVFCNESNSGFSAALLELLLQSHNGLIRVFPAVPRDWTNVAFQNLRAEGAFLISSTRRNGKVIEVVIRSERGGVARLRNPWNDRILSLQTNPNQTIRLHPR